MKTVKFISNDPIQKQFTIELRKKVNAYFKENNIGVKGNFSMFLKTFIMLSIYLLPFITLLTMQVPLWMTILLLLVMGIGAAGTGMSVMHDASHGAFSNKKWVNDLFSSTMFLLGSNTFNWKVQHTILHHTFTNIYGYDQDIETKAMLRLCEHAPIKKYHRYQYIYAYFFYGLMTLSKLITDFNQLLNFNRMGITKKQGYHPRTEIIKLIIVKLFYFSLMIVLPIVVTEYKWWQILLGFCIMQLTAGIIMSTIFQMAHVVEGAKQHIPDNNGIIPNEWLVHELNTTSDFARENVFLNWYVGGLNFQIEHHLFPNICHIHYSRIAPIVEQTVREFGFVYNLKPSFLAAFISHAKRLKTLGK